MRKLWLALIVLSVFASATAFAASANYLNTYGGGIIAEFEQLNPVNPAGIQFTNNFAQLELFNQIAGAAAVVDPNGSPTVDFTFPMFVSLKFNDLLGFRLGIFEPAETAIIPTIQGNVRMGLHTVAISVMSPFSVSWGMKMANMGLGLRYELNTASQGKWADNNYNFSYSKHKIEPGVLLNIGNMAINVIADVNLVFLNWAVATTNTTGAVFTTNTVTPKSPLEMMMIKGQIDLPVNTKLSVAGRIEAGLGMFGYDEKFNANTGTQTNDVAASASTMKFMLGLKYAPLPIVDAYFDIGTKLYGQNVIMNFLGTVTSTNTNNLSQITVPSIALGIAFKPGIFTISLGLSQDIVSSSSLSATAPTLLNNGYELDTAGAVFTTYQGNTVWTMLRKASLGLAINLNPVILEALVDISQGSFLGRELVNPLDILDRIFDNNNADIGVMFTGIRATIVF